jgi:hypothetical protein
MPMVPAGTTKATVLGHRRAPQLEPRSNDTDVPENEPARVGGEPGSQRAPFLRGDARMTGWIMTTVE